MFVFVVVLFICCFAFSPYFLCGWPVDRRTAGRGRVRCVPCRRNEKQLAEQITCSLALLFLIFSSSFLDRKLNVSKMGLVYDTPHDFNWLFLDDLSHSVQKLWITIMHVNAFPCFEFRLRLAQIMGNRIWLKHDRPYIESNKFRIDPSIPPPLFENVTV